MAVKHQAGTGRQSVRAARPGWSAAPRVVGSECRGSSAESTRGGAVWPIAVQDDYRVAGCSRRNAATSEAPVAGVWGDNTCSSPVGQGGTTGGQPHAGFGNLVRRLLRALAAFTLYYTGLFIVYRMLSGYTKGPALIVVMYHRIRTSERPNARTDLEKGVPLRRFAEHVRLLERLGPLTSVREAWLALQGRRARTAVAITFDDAYRDILPAIEVLLRRGASCTVYAVNCASEDGQLLWWDKCGRTDPNCRNSSRTGYAAPGHTTCADREPGRELYLSSAELVWLDRRGVEIGGHTASHPFLAALPERRVVAELAASAGYLRRIGVKWPASFAYPHGSWSEEVAKEVGRAGFLCAVTTEVGINERGSARYALHRIPAGDEHPAFLALRILMSELREFAHPLRRIGALAHRSLCLIRRPTCVAGFRVRRRRTRSGLLSGG